MTAPPSPPSRRLVLVGALGAAAALAGCSKEPEAAAPSPSASPSTSRPQVSADATGTVAPPVRSSLLTGLPVADGPVLAVKIDNTAPARPRVGLGSADVVYVEPVEGGLTRLNAVFSTRMPAEVGPVRSGRVSDASILASYGKVAFAYSGASSYTNARLGKAPLVNVSMDGGGTGYRRERSRRGPYNVIADPAALLRRAGGSVPPNDVGFTFGALPAGGAPVRIATTKYPSATISFAWSRQQRRWVLSTDGTPDVDPSGNQHGAATVVFQHVQVVASDNRDSTGARTPDVVLTGSGTAEVLRDGVAFSAQWSRPDGAGPTSFSWNGAALPFAVGNVWVVLVATKQAVTLA